REDAEREGDAVPVAIGVPGPGVDQDHRPRPLPRRQVECAGERAGGGLQLPQLADQPRRRGLVSKRKRERECEGHERVPREDSPSPQPVRCGERASTAPQLYSVPVLSTGCGVVCPQSTTSRLLTIAAFRSGSNSMICFSLSICRACSTIPTAP